MSWEVFVIIQDGNGGGGEKGLYFECILRVKISFGEDWVWSKREREEIRMFLNFLVWVIGRLLV